MQKVQKSYIPDDWDVYVDGGHNISAAMALATTINEWEKPTFLILGMTRGRDVKKFLEPFEGMVDFVCTVTVQSEPLPYNASYLKEIAQESGFKSEAFDGIEDAVIYLSELIKQPANIMICGSLFLVGDIFIKS